VFLPKHVKKSFISNELRAFRNDLDERIKLDSGKNLDTWQLEFYDRSIAEAREKGYSLDHQLKLMNDRKPYAENQKRRLDEAALLAGLANSFDRDIGPLTASAMIDVKSLYRMLRSARSGPRVRVTGTSEAGSSPSSFPVSGFELWLKVKRDGALARTTTGMDGKYNIQLPDYKPCYIFASQQSSGLLVEWLVPVADLERESGGVDLFNRNASHLVRE
jgi:hypothetical protein